MDLREIGWGGGCGLDLTGSGADHFDCGDKPSGSCTTELARLIYILPFRFIFFLKEFPT
jgi:hypothetical protein